nr:hypothetical protein [Tanacetum cinerariifolium]
MASSSAPQINYAPMVQHSSEYSPPETGLVVLVFQKGDDLIDAINHMMSFLTAVVTSRRVTIQPIQVRQNFMSAGSSRPFTSGSGGASVKQRVIVCYNCKGEGHMSKQCTKPKRKRDAEWFKDKLLDKRLNQLMMMVLVRQTEECDMMLHMEKSDMLMLVAEIEVGDKTADDVDKLACVADVVKPRQVDLKFAHASI